MIIDEQSDSSYYEFLAFKYMDEQFNKLIKLLSQKYPKGNIGVENVRFGKMYFEIAIIIFRLYKVEFSAKQFSDYWNKRIKSDKRITIHQEVNVKIDKIMLSSVSEFSDTPFMALCDNVDMINNSGAINVGWNNDVEINDEFVEKYLRRYFEEQILPLYNKALNEFKNQDSAEKNGHRFKYSIFGMDDKGFLNKEFWTLSFFVTITPRLLIEHFQKFANEHDMWVESNARDISIYQDSLEIYFGPN